MLQGNYTAFKRKEELDKTLMFTNNLQIWLALLSISLLGLLEVGRAIWRWWMVNLTPIQWFFYILGSIMVFFFLAIAIRSLYGLAKLLWHAKFGQNIEYDPETIHENFLTVITPIKAEANLKECGIAIARLITVRNETKGRIKTEVERRIDEYQAIIDALRVKNGDEHRI